jgi:hypothetical protein
MSFVSEGQGLSSKLEGLSLKIIMFKFEDNPFKNNKVIAGQHEIPKYTQIHPNIQNIAQIYPNIA